MNCIDYYPKTDELIFVIQPDDQPEPNEVVNFVRVRFFLPRGVAYDGATVLKWFREMHGDTICQLRDGFEIKFKGSEPCGWWQDEDAALDIISDINEALLEDADYIPHI